MSIPRDTEPFPPFLNTMRKEGDNTHSHDGVDVIITTGGGFVGEDELEASQQHDDENKNSSFSPITTRSLTQYRPHSASPVVVEAPQIISNGNLTGQLSRSTSLASTVAANTTSDECERKVEEEKIRQSLPPKMLKAIDALSFPPLRSQSIADDAAIIVILAFFRSQLLCLCAESNALGVTPPSDPHVSLPVQLMEAPQLLLMMLHCVSRPVMCHNCAEELSAKEAEYALWLERMNGWQDRRGCSQVALQSRSDFQRQLAAEQPSSGPLASDADAAAVSAVGFANMNTEDAGSDNDRLRANAVMRMMNQPAPRPLIRADRCRHDYFRCLRETLYVTTKVGHWDCVAATLLLVSDDRSHCFYNCSASSKKNKKLTKRTQSNPITDQQPITSTVVVLDNDSGRRNKTASSSSPEGAETATCEYSVSERDARNIVEHGMRQAALLALDDKGYTLLEVAQRGDHGMREVGRLLRERAGATTGGMTRRAWQALLVLALFGLIGSLVTGGGYIVFIYVIARKIGIGVPQ